MRPGVWGSWPISNPAEQAGGPRFVWWDCVEQLFSFPEMLKATPATEGDERVVYLEASNEARDYQGERVMAKALAESANYYERYGNIDIQHRSLIGLASGDPDYHMHEIGRP